MSNCFWFMGSNLRCKAGGKGRRVLGHCGSQYSDLFLQGCQFCC